MSLTPRLDLRQTQSLNMTVQLRQAIGLLQMSAVELNDFLSAELERNPLLQREEDAVAENIPDENGFDGGEFDGRDALPDLCDKTDADEAPPDMPDFTDEDSFYEHSAPQDDGFDTSDFSTDAWRGQGNADETFQLSDVCAAPKPSLHSVLVNQINAAFAEQKERRAAFCLLEEMTEDGFLPADLTVVQKRSEIDGNAFAHLVAVMKTFEPTGIFSQSLEEFFAAQLKENDRYDPAMAELLRHLDLIASREYEKLAKLCGVTAEDLSDMLAELRRLNPRCTTDYDISPVAVVIPDVLVRRDKTGGFVVELNQAALPRVLVNRRYAAEISAAAGTSKEAKKFLSEHTNSADFIVKALQQRAESILKTATYIVENQKEFFKSGVRALKPMILKDVADAVALHESTISRVTNNKYLACAFGVFELKYFFSKALETAAGDAVSAVSVKDFIRETIAAETPENVLSDEDLVVLLNKKGIQIARRTVAKYRESLGIATSARRKREKRLKTQSFLP